MKPINADACRCINCALASEHYPSFIDSCDLDGHVILDAETEVCGQFVRSDG
ncbi:hypothetical protein LI291_10615 [Intestinibacillus massiliensis]|nr:hypothetical protein [Intestinibacillus massiliensis]